jgi:hypothetical protein
MPNILIKNYEGLASSCNALIQSEQVSPIEQALLEDFLLAIIYFASEISGDQKMSAFNSLVGRTLTAWSEMKEAFLDKSIPEHLIGKVTLEFLGFMSLAANLDVLKEAQSPASPSSELERRRVFKVWV